jgi:ribonuclease BN (tRNA processing enzyme)
MEIRVLGCSGGVGANLNTTTLLLDQDILIDAGTGVGNLTIDEMSRIRHIFLTHSHLDHIACFPLLIDTLFDRIVKPIHIHAQPATIEALQKHIFNNKIWPDFASLPTPDKPVMRFQPMNPGEICRINDRSFDMIRVNHIVPGVGYRVESPDGVFAFSGDTTSNDTFWEALNAKDRLDALIVEAAFPNAEIDLCRRAGHYCATLLAEDLEKLQHKPTVYISHNKPGAEQTIFAECQAAINGLDVHPLSGDDRITL